VVHSKKALLMVTGSVWREAFALQHSCSRVEVPVPSIGAIQGGDGYITTINPSVYESPQLRLT
jgi:hypothetical protein